MPTFEIAGGKVVDGNRVIFLNARDHVPVFKPGKVHDHQPTGGPASGRWEKAVSWWQTITFLPGIPVLGILLKLGFDQFYLYLILQTFWLVYGRNMTPAELMEVVANPLYVPDWLSQGVAAATLGLLRTSGGGYGTFADKPIALRHLHYFLSDGHGHPFDESDYLEQMLKEDTSVQDAIRSVISGQRRVNGVIEGDVLITQDNYSNQDFRFAFGAIDTLSYRADYNEGTLKAWFLDRYEWHPHYPGLPDMYPVQRDDDGPQRETNVVHAACVELKAGTARDFWMAGIAKVPLDVLDP